jgi:hypothetical protein
MSTPIIITVGDVELSAELNDSSTSQDVIDQLPIEASANRWGDELYFSIPVGHPAEPDARDEMAVGELAYWPVGNAFCIFFGPTPASHGDEPRAADSCNPLGHVLDDIHPLFDANSGVRVQIRLG